jgi:hypothetical protein
MPPVSDDSVKCLDVLNRELEQSHEPNGPRIRYTLCHWSPDNDDLWSWLYRCPQGGEHVPARIFLPRLHETFFKDFDASRICRGHNRMSALRQ